MFHADHFAKLSLGYQEAGADPALDLVAWPPTLYVAADGLDHGKGGLDHVGAGQGATELRGDAKPVDGERFLQAFLQATRRAGVTVQGAMAFLAMAEGTGWRFRCWEIAQ